jgi:hypothetical protein
MLRQPRRGKGRETPKLRKQWGKSLRGNPLRPREIPKRANLGAMAAGLIPCRGAPSQSEGSSPGTKSPQGLLVSGLGPESICSDE